MNTTVIESLEYNRRLNSNTASRVSVSPLDWSRVAQLDASDRYDVLIGADLLYSGYNVVPDLFDITSEISENGIDHGNFVQIAKVIDCVLSGKGNAHLFCRVRENEEEFDYFYEELASLGFQTDVRAVDVQVCSAAVDAKEYPFVVKHIHAYRQSSLDP
ncbi:hypothetical protein SARC_02200 [Sphaeroforma arctica JP610]|uniref:Uncharacterized protein n=1 Tax=Sphaeroforma arctica JP610 TaxID=667725 RepID=A0A0L0G9D7_9EUKA|nr:hypothetical protein SARC_02200 [Sphaeroforma arctica JP610]KNC85627.1 hypothetical protein SARC_02200 [Sphaeroforma arctica JP610]|eukprot:XP_014159529.1 hypothetical protein SARC_02200 [Sphaeroforma arctica JP610]